MAAIKKTQRQLTLERNNLMVKAKQWQDRVKEGLNQTLGGGDRFRGGGGSPMGRADMFNGWSGGLVYGTAPNDKQVADYIRQIGGNPYAQQAQQITNRTATSAPASPMAHPAGSLLPPDTASPYSQPQYGLQQYGQPQQGSQGSYGKRVSVPQAPWGWGGQQQSQQQSRQKQKKDTRLEDFLAEAQAKYEEANAANESRYGDILGRLEGSRDRNLERVENYGVAAGQDLEQRAAEALGNIQANLSARGLGSSTIQAAFQQRNASDLAREQQRLSEMVDSRTAGYDQNLTRDIAGFMERRNDVAPDFNSIAALAQQYGLSGDGQGYDTPTQYQPQQPQQQYQQPQQQYQQPIQQQQPPTPQQQFAPRPGSRANPQIHTMTEEVQAPQSRQPQRIIPYSTGGVGNRAPIIMGNPFGAGLFDGLPQRSPGIVSNRYPENRHANTNNGGSFGVLQNPPASPGWQDFLSGGGSLGVLRNNQSQMDQVGMQPPPYASRPVGQMMPLTGEGIGGVQSLLPTPPNASRPVGQMMPLMQAQHLNAPSMHSKPSSGGGGASSNWQDNSSNWQDNWRALGNFLSY